MTSPTLPQIVENPWQPIETAPKDGRYIIALYQSLTGEGYAARLHGRAFVVRHEGKTVNDYDMGWALFPGFGGVPDKCLSHWMPLPALPEEVRTHLLSLGEGM